MDGEDRDQATHKAFIEANHDRIAGIARDGYRAHGRGAIFIFEDAILDAASGDAGGVTVEYVADGSDALARRGGWPTEGHADLVRGYDPGHTMVVLVGRRRGVRELFTYQLLCDDADRAGPDEFSLPDLMG